MYFNKYDYNYDEDYENDFRYLLSSMNTNYSNFHPIKPYCNWGLSPKSIKLAIGKNNHNILNHLKPFDAIRFKYYNRSSKNDDDYLNVILFYFSIISDFAKYILEHFIDSFTNCF